jgi:hypothetical protein
MKLRQHLANEKMMRMMSWTKKIILILLALFAFGVWRFGWGWTGFFSYTTYTITSTGIITEVHAGKTLWDVLDLLIIPIALALGAFLLNQAERQNELKIAKDQEEQKTLKDYIDAMTELLTRIKGQRYVALHERER